MQAVARAQGVQRPHRARHRRPLREELLVHCFRLHGPNAQDLRAVNESLEGREDAEIENEKKKIIINFRSRVRACVCMCWVFTFCFGPTFASNKKNVVRFFQTDRPFQFCLLPSARNDLRFLFPFRRFPNTLLLTISATLFSSHH